MAFGIQCQSAHQVVSAVRKVCKKPLMVKLSPNVTDIASIAQAVEAEGARCHQPHQHPVRHAD